MNVQDQRPRTPHDTLTDLDIVTPELSRKISAAASVGSRMVRESFIHRYSHSTAEFAAACEMAEKLGLVIYC